MTHWGASGLRGIAQFKDEHGNCQCESLGVKYTRFLMPFFYDANPNPLFNFDDPNVLMDTWSNLRYTREELDLGIGYV